MMFTALNNLAQADWFHVAYAANELATRAALLIECDCHAYLLSKAGSVIIRKSPSPAFRWSSIYYTEP